MNKIKTMDSKYSEIITRAYAGFNARDIDAVFIIMHPNVSWPKAFEGGFVTGYNAVREYWTRQWSEINPKVEPLAIEERPDGKVAVEVAQLVKDMDGNVLFDGIVKHVYLIKNNLISGMEIEMF